MTDDYNLQRFVEAQGRVYASVLRELATGEKRTHWMWYVSPQAAGLGMSSMSMAYAISSAAEAQAYAGHAILGPRLRECTKLVLGACGRSIEQIFGHPDHLKFRSSMTLFALCTADNALFNQALEKYFDGKGNERTVQIVTNWRQE